ncbi:fluoride efflux transporter CrcB [Cytobacillus sp. NCCP-133]|uniref:fluoride efflux transporter CrcB n=1 Tax=Cytobacillus sp. NCCP-133 TaxID=766848 RepID=UPI00222FD05B|nr:fluoride efflux transporter CrcB [Cytobacillus sp. NCCP-133]GLB59583.1 chromosome condensation protein CrcB [Cytobacillus sp. NCCP-133]
MSVINILLVGIGGFLGAVARFSLSKLLNNKTDTSFPIGTLTVNLLGSFLLGVIIGTDPNEMAVLLMGTGFMGAFTTFSTLKLEMMHLHLNEHRKVFMLYIAITYGAGITLAYAGFMLGRMFIE